jgi:hypothetical protein
MAASKPGRSAAAPKPSKPSGGRKLSASKFMASKPQRAKAAAADSEEEEEEGGGVAYEEEEEEEAGARVTATERRAARLDRKKAALQADAQAEAQDAAVQEYEPFELPSTEALDAEQSAPDLPSVRRRIQDVARVLANFKRLRQPGRTRAEYMERLMADLERYYGCGRRSSAPEARTQPSPKPPANVHAHHVPASAQVQRVLPGVHPERLQRG